MWQNLRVMKMTKAIGIIRTTLSYQNVLKYYGECSNILAMLIYQFSLNELQEHLKPVFACY